jgi:hypothetical protein
MVTDGAGGRCWPISLQKSARPNFSGPWGRPSKKNTWGTNQQPTQRSGCTVTVVVPDLSTALSKFLLSVA